MTEVSLASYESLVSKTAYFMQLPTQSQRAALVQRRLREETAELLTRQDPAEDTELRKLLWGEAAVAEANQSIASEQVSEAGDVLYLLTAAGRVMGIPLSKLARSGIAAYTGISRPPVPETIAVLDRAVQNRIAPKVPAGWNPDYMQMQYWGALPYYPDPVTGFVPAELADRTRITADRAPVFLIADGLYVLERLLRNAADCVGSPSALEKQLFLASAGLALGALSAVTQSRLASSLNEAAAVNTGKLERRLSAGTLQHGIDTERSRGEGEQRPVYAIGETVTEEILFRSI